MLNQEQLAAIAAAMSILQRSMQSPMQQQQALMNHFQAQLQQPQQQQQQSVDLGALLRAPSPTQHQSALAVQKQHQLQQQQPQHQHHQQHHYQQQQQQQQQLHGDLGLLRASSPKQHHVPFHMPVQTVQKQQQQELHHHQQQHQRQQHQQQQHQQQQQQSQSLRYDRGQVLTPTPVAKVNRAISYSAIVAKSTHTANSTSNDIFNPHDFTAISLGHTNGSLLKQESNNILALEPTLNYTTDHSTSLAQQLLNNSIRQNNLPSLQQHQDHHINNINATNNGSISITKSVPPHGRATNLLGFMGLYVGNLSPDLTKEQLEKIFSKYGEPVKAHRLIRSPVAFIKYENTESPRAAIDDLYGLLLPELTLNQDQPLKLHFDRNDAQLKANYRPTELPREDNGECYGWRTTVCRKGKNCPKKHIPINRGIDFQMWMIKSNTTTTTS